MLGYTTLNVNNTANHLLIAHGHATNNQSGASTNLNHVNMTTITNNSPININNNTSILNGSVVGGGNGINVVATSATSSKNLLNNSTIKMIQRILEESSQTGDLILTSKNLNEFPSKLANNYDLSDTITAGNLNYYSSW